MNDEHLEKLLREIDEEDNYAWLKETNAGLREKIGILFNKNKQLETQNAVLREDKEALDWIDENVQTVFFKFKPDKFRLNIRETFKRARAREAKPDA